MKIDFLQDRMVDAMGNYMTRLSKRQQVVASNIANIDTPGYTTKDISFHATMSELLSGNSVGLRGNQPGHKITSEWVAEPEVFEVRDQPARVDGNNVNIDKEMLKLGETSFGYSLMSQLLRGKFRTIASSINEGRAG